MKYKIRKAACRIFFRTNVYRVLIPLLLLPAAGFSQPAGYGYGKQIVINASQVSGTGSHTNFPILVSFTDPNLRTTANGGNVTSSSGFDIRFTSSDCTTFLDHQVERYNPVTGEFIAWVRIPSLSTSVNTIIHMYYGNSSVVATTSTTATWNANYFGVYHFNSSISDGTSAGNNLTNVNTTNLTGSIIGEGRDLNNNTNVLSSVTTGQHLVVPNGVFSGVTNFTWSGWVYLDRDATNWERIFDFGKSTTVNFFFTPSIDVTSPSQTRARITTGGNASEQGPSINNPSASTGSWIYWAVTIDNASNTLSVYKNGALYGSAAGVTLRPNNMEASITNYFGRSQYSADHYIDAKFDEFRLSRAVHSASWVATEYNNQSAPSAFYSVSAQMSAAALCNTALPVELLYFDAYATAADEVATVWSTASEKDNDYFTVERSDDGLLWEKIQTVQGAGTTSSTSLYSATDHNPLRGLSYYRLKQTDFSGHAAYSQIKSVFLRSLFTGIYPNPAENRITLPAAIYQQDDFSVYTPLGQEVTVQMPLISETTDIVVMDLSQLPPGVYIVKTHTFNGVFHKQ